MKAIFPDKKAAWTVGQIRHAAINLWRDGWQGDKTGKPIDPAKPLIPAVIARRLGVSLSVGAQINHCLVMWSIGSVKVGEYEAL